MEESKINDNKKCTDDMNTDTITQCKLCMAQLNMKANDFYCGPDKFKTEHKKDSNGHIITNYNVFALSGISSPKGDHDILEHNITLSHNATLKKFYFDIKVETNCNKQAGCEYVTAREYSNHITWKNNCEHDAKIVSYVDGKAVCYGTIINGLYHGEQVQTFVKRNYVRKRILDNGELISCEYIK